MGSVLLPIFYSLYIASCVVNKDLRRLLLKVEILNISIIASYISCKLLRIYFNYLNRVPAISWKYTASLAVVLAVYLQTLAIALYKSGPFLNIFNNYFLYCLIIWRSVIAYCLSFICPIFKRGDNIHLLKSLLPYEVDVLFINPNKESFSES